MAYSDLDGIHVPTSGTRPPASWGAQVNANFDELYDEFLAKIGQWTDFTPALTQSATITKTVNYARYIKYGRMVTASMSVTASSAGTANNKILIGLPVTAATSGIIVGSFYVYDASAALAYTGAASLNATANVGGFAYGSGGTVYMGSTGSLPTSLTIASGDSVLCHVVYESAS